MSQSESMIGSGAGESSRPEHGTPPADTNSPELEMTAIEPPEPEDQESAGDQPAQVAESQPKSPNVTQKELEDLASRLATERVKHIKDVSDPLEAWEKARADILSQMAKSR